MTRRSPRRSTAPLTPSAWREVEDLYRKKAERIIVGTGQYGQVHLSQEAAEFLKAHRCQVDLWPTPQAIEQWNEAEGNILGLFHITC